MSADTWLEANNRYLAVSLQWLRLRFQLLVDGRRPALGAELEAASARRQAAAAETPSPALILLAERFGLSDFERDTLLLCAALEFDPGIGALCGQAQGGATRTWPTFGLALSLLEDPTWDALAAHRPLRFARLLEISQPGGTPLTGSPLRADERIVNFLKGLNVLDDRLTTFIDPVGEGVGETLSGSQEVVVTTILRRLHDAATEPLVPLVQLLGSVRGSQIAVANRVCSALNRRLYRLGADGLPAQGADVETLARLWQRETFLIPVALYIDAESLDGGAPEVLAVFRRFLSRGLGLVFIGTREAALQLGLPTIAVEVRRPTPAEQFAAWTAEGAPEASALAGQFSLDLEEIGGVASQVPASLPPELQAERLWNACRELTRPRLDALAPRLDVKATWDDLVLPDEQMALMRQIAGQVRARHKVYGDWGFSQRMNRGFGISALFAGESGTGKTMAAEVLASDLKLDLYRIDLSAVVSKYIGETEKNLRRLFDAAEQGGAILFFDEADALFGKRSEVKDSHDRYANIEINYLLQRMEAFGGLAILATNMKSALDPAFMRRLRFIVQLPFPGVKERQQIWQKALPVATPRKDLDFGRLARLNLSGGNIHSIALNAAFAAAQNGQTVTTPIMLSAARAELRKLERPYHEADLR